MYRISLYLLLSLPIFAQTQTGPYSIGGNVSNSLTGEAVTNAVVTLDFLPAPGVDRTTPVSQSSGPTSMSILAGIGGDFVFNDLPEGRYRLRAEKPGFVAEQGPPSDTLGSGVITLTSSSTNTHLKLSPLGVIEGTVVDQSGEPVPGVNIVALSVSIVDGLQTTRSQRSVSTNDIGAYRIWNLQPGKYYIKAAGRSGGTFTYIGDNGPIFDSLESFSPVYSGGAQDLDSAMPVSILPGTHARADINLIREPAVKVRGVISNFGPTPAVKFELLRGEEDVSASRVALNGTTGRFEIQDVTPGSYLLRATQGSKARAETLITVGNRDVSNVSLVLSQGVTVKAIVHSLGSAVVSRRDDLEADAQRFRQPLCQVSLIPSARSSDGTRRFTRSVEGELNAAEVLPGAYRLGLQCFGGYVLSALSGNTDLLLDPRLVIHPGVPPPPIEITVKAGGGRILGNLVLKEMLPQLALLLVPASSASTGPILVPAFESSDGIRFAFESLSPGDYIVYAFSRRDDVEYRNPLFLQSLTGGTSVHIDEDSEKEITITSLTR